MTSKDKSITNSHTWTCPSCGRILNGEKEQIIEIIKQDLEFEYDYFFLDVEIDNVADQIIALLPDIDKQKDLIV